MWPAGSLLWVVMLASQALTAAWESHGNLLARWVESMFIGSYISHINEFMNYSNTLDVSIFRHLRSIKTFKTKERNQW